MPLDRILAACHRHLVTGEIKVDAGGVKGTIELRAGAVDRAELGNLKGARALNQLRLLVDGWYELTQRLPDLTGELGGSSCEGDVTGVPLIALMRHCEYHALTCAITVVSRFDRAQIHYHAGELERVELNGFYDDDAIVQVLDWSDARFRVSAPPLDLDIEGWPKVRREPTLPFALGERFARGTSPSLSVMTGRPTTPREPTLTSLPPPPPEPSVVGATPATGKPWTSARAESMEVELEIVEERSAPIVAAAAPVVAAPSAVRPTPTPSRPIQLMPVRAEVLPAEEKTSFPSATRRLHPVRRWFRVTLALAIVISVAAAVYLLAGAQLSIGW